MKKMLPFVLTLIKKYETNVPDDIAEYLNVSVTRVALPLSVAGAYAKVGPKKVILINNQYDKDKQNVALAHELGHYLLNHGDVHTVAAHLLPNDAKDAQELQANKFAFLLIAHTCLRNSALMIDAIRDERLLTLDDTTFLLKHFERTACYR